VGGQGRRKKVDWSGNGSDGKWTGREIREEFYVRKCKESRKFMRDGKEEKKDYEK